MSKKIIALVLCLALAVPFLSACKKDENYVGPIVNMYLSEMIYDFDPLYAYNNESALKVVSLLFEPLFKLDEKGKLVKGLVKDYTYKVDEVNKEYSLIINLNETNWSDGTYVSANDFVYTCKRILDPENSNEAASLLFEIQNARLVKEAEASIDTLGVYAVGEREIEIVFDHNVDIDAFLYNLTSYALVPLREDIVEKNDDWAKKSSTIVCSGPFIIRESDYNKDPRVAAEDKNPRLYLERNSYYYRDKLKDSIDKSVTPFKIKINFSVPRDEQYNLYKGEFANEEDKIKQVFFMNDFPLSVRNDVKDKVEVYDTNSTHSYIFNTEALVAKKGSNEGYALFADARVRKALSLAIDREAIAQQIVFAKAADGYVPFGVFAESSYKKTYRSATSGIISTSADVSAAQALLKEAGINPSDYTFSISVRAGKEVHQAIAEAVKNIWCNLGFNVEVVAVEPIVNDDKYFGEDPQQDICDDVYNETYFHRHPAHNKDGSEVYRSFEVLATDVVAPSVNPLSVLAPLALKFSGQGMDLSSVDGLVGDQVYTLTPHISGYNSEAYNRKIEEAFAEKDLAKRLALLQDAEKILMEDMPVMPIVYNQGARLVSKELKGIEYNWNGLAIFTDAMLKNFDRFAEPTDDEEFIEEAPVESGEETQGE